MTLGGLGVLDSPNSSGWPAMVCQGCAPMDQLSKSRTNTHPSLCLIMCLPALCLLAFQLDHTGQTQDLPKILQLPPPPLQNNHGSFFILSSKENQKNTIWRKGSSHHVPTCTMSPGFDWTIQGKPKTCQRFTSQLPPPSKTTTGPLSSCLLKRNQKNTIWRKGSSHYVSTCTMSPVFSTRPSKTSPRLAKDSHLNFQPPPSKTTTGPLSSCLLKKGTRKTPFGGRVVLIMCLPALCLLAFQLDHTGQTQDLPKIHLSTSTPLQNNHGSFVILSSKKKPEKRHLEEG